VRTIHLDLHSTSVPLHYSIPAAAAARGVRVTLTDQQYPRGPYSFPCPIRRAADGARHGQQEQGGGAAPLLPVPGRGRRLRRRGVYASLQCCTGCELFISVGDAFYQLRFSLLIASLRPCTALHAPISMQPTILKVIAGGNGEGEELEKGGGDGRHKHEVINDTDRRTTTGSDRMTSTRDG
jgi:hypothetical protein